MTRWLLAPRDARAFWASSVIPSDQFLLYCFDHGGAPSPSAAEVADQVIARAPSVPDLRLRVAPAPLGLEHPAWAPCDVIDVREGVARHWDRVPEAVARLFARQVDATVVPWRLHVFPHVAGAPRCAGTATVVVLQIAHVLADGRRSADIARRLFGAEAPGPEPVPPPPPPAPVRAARGLAGLPIALARTVARGIGVGGARAEIDRRTRAGELPEPVPGCPPTVLNARPDESRDVRMLVREGARVAGTATVTVGALTAVSVAVERYLRRRGGAVPERLCAEVMVARPPRGDERNAFGNVSVPLFPGIPAEDRPARIAAALDGARRRAGSGLWRTVGAADDASPAVLAQLGVHAFDPGLRPELMAGTTVLSSVNRGPADLRLLGGRSAFTAGFPALSPAMGLTHGVHGLGDAVAISVTSSRTAVPDPDAYAAILAEALDARQA
ncbi:wax ester/triacylglycerol synthase domain-containing protein [Tsukamurella sp. 1534]|uniref:wax ester/triacylglycerol synthase domain-containing protein n=1 Tax=Tsukamurella sp. 1534 TaxID=1151061 RepID=UPI000305DE3A|nr:wax ester/triacylglycerol synthase domain-containing protein [Tsukamurella sp. 1534]